jgi:phosphoadenosine phosphosulfate reductase
MADLEHKAIKRLQLAAKMSQQYYQEPLLICNSGGKDSLILLSIAKAAGIEYEVVHSHTTADAPETVRYVRKQMYELECAGIKAEINYPAYRGKRTSMWDLIPRKLMPPTRFARYCCKILKENTGNGRFIVTGVRASESRGRADSAEFETRTSRKADKGRFSYEHTAEVFSEAQTLPDVYDCQMITACKKHKQVSVLPIVDWTNRDVWGYIRSKHLEYNPLYDYGFNRVGCIGCPLASRKIRLAEFVKYPKYENMYRHAFNRCVARRKALGKSGVTDIKDWSTGAKMFDWWMEDKNVDGQLEFEGVKDHV